jgi:carbon-monoxide dehydrogenase large subunit
MIVEGQIHGGIAQGIGQAVMEQIVFDAKSGQLLTGSFLDYALPRAEDLPDFAVASNSIPAQSNPLGVKGAGEAGVTPATSVVVNAILDALKDFGVAEIEMPATPERIWRAIKAASR